MTTKLKRIPAALKRVRRKAPRTLQERKQDLVRSAIWDAATDLFGEKGYDAVTVEDIAAKAGVSRRSFFRYFSSKSDLMAHGVVGYGAHLTETIGACPADFSPAEIFRHTVVKVAQECAANPRARKIMEIAAKYPEAREALSRTGDLQQRVEEAFARRCRERNEKDMAPGVLAGLTLAVLSVIFRLWFERGGRDISAATEQVLSTMGRLVQSQRR
jgi:TetR/AcrR family transcriptional regulator, regulator of mycofactocin system